MKNKKVKAVNIAAAIIFAGAFFLNIHANSNVRIGFFGIPAIGAGTGFGGSSGGSGEQTYSKQILPCECTDSNFTIHIYAYKCRCLNGFFPYCVETDCPPSPDPDCWSPY